MPRFQAFRVFSVVAIGRPRLCAHIHCADGKTRNLGRIDRKWLGVYVTPRAWFYRHVTYPRLAKQYGGQ